MCDFWSPNREYSSKVITITEIVNTSNYQLEREKKNHIRKRKFKERRKNRILPTTTITIIYIKFNGFNGAK